MKIATGIIITVFIMAILLFCIYVWNILFNEDDITKINM